jgi:putative transposase
VKRNYHTIDKQGKVGERKLAEFLVRNGQALLPMLELIEQSRMAIDELIDVMGRASVEAVLELSATQVAGPPQPGKARQADIVWHGRQAGRVFLKERQLKVNKPRLRKPGRGANKELAVPAYEAMQRDTATGERMLQILLNGVSTRRYHRVIPEMADTAGVSKSTVSREAVEASEAALKHLLERRFDDVDLLIIYVDGMKFQDQCVLAAVGVDVEGRKHVLALREGATENAEAAKDLLQHLVEHGVDPTHRRLFVIDGSKALRTAINAVFGAETPVQRCRNHKLRNVLGRLPREQQTQTASLMRAAWKMNPNDGMAKFRQIAGWLEHDYPDAAAALLNASPSTGWISRVRCIDVWPPATSWTIPIREFATAPGVCAAGERACRRAGPLRPS